LTFSPCDAIISNTAYHNKELEMAKATIKSKTGAIITIEGSEHEVSNILAGFDRLAGVQQTKAQMARHRAERKEERKRMTASDIILGLQDDGFFNKPKTLTEIAEALEEKGHIYPTTSLSGVMLALVKRRLFGRKKTDGKWVYGK
jgi:hypothetical protein